MVRLSLRDGRYLASALDEAGAQWLRSIASTKCEFHEAGVLVDTRFINEFVDAAEAAGVGVSVHARPLERSLVA